MDNPPRKDNVRSFIFAFVASFCRFCHSDVIRCQDHGPTALQKLQQDRKARVPLGLRLLPRTDGTEASAWQQASKQPYAATGAASGAQQPQSQAQARRGCEDSSQAEAAGTVIPSFAGVPRVASAAATVPRTPIAALVHGLTHTIITPGAMGPSQTLAAFVDPPPGTYLGSLRKKLAATAATLSECVVMETPLQELCMEIELMCAVEMHAPRVLSAMTAALAEMSNQFTVCCVALSG